MGYCYRCWKWEGKRKETQTVMKWEVTGRWTYLCLPCLSEIAKPTPLWRYFLSVFIFIFSLAFWAFISYKAGEQAGRRKGRRRL